MWQAAQMVCDAFEGHWPPPAACGPLCRFGLRRGRWPPRCHTVCRSSGPRRWPSDSPDLCAHIQSYSESVAVLISGPARCQTVTFCVPRQNSFPVCFSIQLIILPAPPSLLSVFPPPPFPILFALINPYLLPYYAASPPYCSISHPLPPFIHSPQTFTQRTSTDHPPRERFLSVSSEILPDLLVQVIVSIPLRGSKRSAIWHSSGPRLHPCWWRLIEILCQAALQQQPSLPAVPTQQLSVPLIQIN